MEAAHLDELISIEQTYWWHVAKQEIVLQALRKFCPPPARILEGGVGGGNNLRTLQSLGYRVSGLDIMPDAIDHCHKLGLNEVVVHDLQEPWPAAPASVDAVIMLDVIEHCDDAPRVLTNAKNCLVPGGKVILTVPAIPALMGPWDEALGHKRRYTYRMLAAHAEAADLKMIWCSHWNSFSLPPALVLRTFERFFVSKRNSEFPRVSDFVNNSLIALSAMERAVMEKMPIPIGLSLVGVLEK